MGKKYLFIIYIICGPTNTLSNTLGLLSKHNSSKQIIMGDFNAISTDMPEFPAAGYQETFTLTGSSITSIDMLYVNPSMLDVINTGMILGSDTVSDHPAIYSIIQPN